MRARHFGHVQQPQDEACVTRTDFVQQRELANALCGRRVGLERDLRDDSVEQHALNLRGVGFVGGAVAGSSSGRDNKRGLIAQGTGGKGLGSSKRAGWWQKGVDSASSRARAV